LKVKLAREYRWLPWIKGIHDIKISKIPKAIKIFSSIHRLLMLNFTKQEVITDLQKYCKNNIRQDDSRVAEYEFEFGVSNYNCFDIKKLS